MAELSLKRHLAQIGEPRSSDTVRIPADFKAVPPSGRLRDFMKAMRSPEPEQWRKTAEREFANKDWTPECQGVTNDGHYWYLPSNQVLPDLVDRELRGVQQVYRLSRSEKVVGRVGLAGNGSDHLGDIDFYKGRIYCAMDGPPKIVVIDTPPFTEWWVAPMVGAPGEDPPQTRCAWCAVNPWNGLLYSAQITQSIAGDTLFAYRLDEAGRRFVHEPAADLVLPENLLFIQGAVFSENGRVLLASHDTHDIRCYSVLNGHYFGSAAIEVDDSWNEAEEVEGLTIWTDVTYDGEATQVHVVLLDNDWPDTDDVYFKHYSVPLPADL